MGLWSRFVAHHPAATLLLVLLASTAFAGALVDREQGALRLRIDPSLDRLLQEDDPERQLYEHVRHVFGNDETVLVALESEDVFSPESIARVERLTGRLEELPGVHHVLSLATAPNLRGDEEGIELRTVAEVAREGGAELERLRADVLANPLYAGTLVSRDARTTALVVYFKGVSDREMIEGRIPERIAALADEERGSGAAYLAGAPVAKAATSRALLRELRVAIPGMIALGAVLLWLAFGSWQGVVLPLVTIGLALLWTLATLALLDRPLNLVTSIVPPLLIALGLAYAMHVLAEFNALPGGGSAERRERIRHQLDEVSLPLGIAGGTTVAGLLALAVTPIPAIQEFGLLAALGVGYTLVLTLSFVPAGIALMGQGRAHGAAPGEAAFLRAADRLANLASRRRRPILAAGMVVAVLAAAGATGITIGSEYIGDFRADARVRRDYEAVNRALGGANPFYVFVESNVRDLFTEPEYLGEIESLQRWLEAQPEIGATTSLVDHLKLLNQSMTGDPEAFRIPDDPELIKQLFIFGGGEELESYTDSLFHGVNLLVRARVDDSAAIAGLLARIETRLAELPRPLQGRVTGNGVLVNRTLDQISRGQVQSLGAALLVVYLILCALFTSFRVGLLALLPNALPILVYFGVLGFTGVPLGPATSLIACIALGIAIDDTVHYLVRFNTEARRTASEEQAVGRALRSVLRPVTFTSLTLCGGFLVLTGSELRSQVQFGALTALTLAVAWVIDVTLTPALCSGVRIVSLWDVLRLDLGREPHRSIPLFDGLTARQARTFALTADIVDLAPGHPVIREGEVGSDMFVVIEGDLSAYVDRASGRQDLARLGRGALFGETGHFGQPRTATVETLSPVRLLRFEDDDLERLLLRYPKIAAYVYRNLGRTQAERSADNLSRVR